MASLNAAGRRFTLGAFMAELQTYVFPAIQAFFLLIMAIAWLVGFIRQRNLGFLPLTIVFLAEGVATGTRQAIINHVFYHEPGLPVSERTSYVSLIGLSLWAFSLCFGSYRPRRVSDRVPSPKISA
jgi:hypothetical protein